MHVKESDEDIFFLILKEYLPILMLILFSLSNCTCNLKWMLVFFIPIK